MSDPTREGRWGIRQYVRGESIGSATIGCGWPTEAEALAACTPHGDSTYQPFERWAVAS